jgi:hypothetical protein
MAGAARTNNTQFCLTYSNKLLNPERRATVGLKVSERIAIDNHSPRSWFGNLRTYPKKILKNEMGLIFKKGSLNIDSKAYSTSGSKRWFSTMPWNNGLFGGSNLQTS